MPHAIIRGGNGRRHEVDVEDAKIRIEVYSGDETVEIVVEQSTTARLRIAAGLRSPTFQSISSRRRSARRRSARERQNRGERSRRPTKSPGV
jgi:hypothetical protein